MGRSAVAIHEGVGDVHLHILGDDFFEGRLRHLLYDGQDGVEVQAVGEAEAALGYVERANLSGEVVETVEEILVYLAQSLGGAHSICLMSPDSKSRSAFWRLSSSMFCLLAAMLFLFLTSAKLQTFFLTLV